MSKQQILKTLRGLAKGSSIRTEPLTPPGIETTVRQTGPGQISIAEAPEVQLPRLSSERQPEGTTSTGIEFNEPSDLAQTHPETYDALAQTREAKRAGGVDKLITKMAVMTGESDPNNVLQTAMRTGEDVGVIGARASEADETLSTINSKARVTVLNNYLESMGLNSKQRGSTAESLMKSAKAGDGGLGDRLARRRLRQIQDEQIAANQTFDAAQRLVATARAGIDDVNITTRADSGAHSAAAKLQSLDPVVKTKVANKALGKIQRMLLTGKTAEKVGLGKNVTGAARTTLVQSIGKSLRNVKGLQPDGDWEYNGELYRNLKGQEKLRADKKWEVNLANVILERLLKDGEYGYLTAKKNVGVAMDRSKFLALSKINKGEIPEGMNPQIATEIKEMKLNSPLLAQSLGFESPDALVKQYSKWKDKYDSGGWDEWEIKPTKQLIHAMDGFRDVEKTGVTPNFGPATKSTRADELITAKLDLDDDLQHIRAMTPKNAPVFFDAVNHLQATKLDIDNDILDRIKSLSQRPRNGITPHVRTDAELSNFDDDLVRRQKNREKDEDRFVDYENTIKAAGQYKDQGGFHFDVWADFRGRIGYRSAYVNPQGDPVSRSLLTLHDEMKVPMNQAWEDDIVNEMLSYYGPTKNMTPNQRLQYWEVNKPSLIAIGRNWNDSYGQWADSVKTKDALPFLKAATELFRKYELGATKSGFMTGLDAVTSQAQMLAAGFRDSTLGRFVALTPDQASEDLYQIAAKDVWRLMNEDANNPLAQYWTSPAVSQHSRAIMKRPVMTDTYNAGKSTMADALEKDATDFPSPMDANNPLHYIEREHADYLIDTLVKVLNDTSTDAGRVFQSVTGIKTATKEAAKELVYDTGRTVTAKSGKVYPILEYSQKPGEAFTSKSGFKFRQHYRSHETGQVRARTLQPDENGNVVVEPQASFGYRLPTTEPRNDTLNSMKTSFAPNTIHSWDADVLHHTVKYLADDNIPAITVHDQFFVPAGYSEQLRRAYVKALKTVFEGDRLKEMLSERIDSRKVDEIMAKANLNRGDLDLDVLDKMLDEYWEKGVSPINVG